MREFVNQTDAPIRVISGASVIYFVPGQTRPVPEVLVDAARDAGLVEVHYEPAQPEPAQPEPAQPEPAERSAASPSIDFDKFALWRAFDAIAADGDARLFNKDGTPKLREVKRLYGQPGLTRDIVEVEWRMYSGDNGQ